MWIKNKVNDSVDQLTHLYPCLYRPYGLLPEQEHQLKLKAKGINFTYNILILALKNLTSFATSKN